MTEGPLASLREAIGAPEIAEVRTLFEEYAGTLGIDLEFQNFGEELAGLPGAYSRPGGLLLLAAIGARSVGCVAVRRLDDDRCEMKRLYVRDEGRGHGVGLALATAAIAFARTAGYRIILLDTLPSMAAAQTMYRRLGFREVPPYRYNPVPGTSFMELTLADDPPTGGPRPAGGS